MKRIPITTIQILLPALNFYGQSLKPPNECDPIISDHTKQHCRYKRWLLLKPENLWSYHYIYTYTLFDFEFGEVKDKLVSSS